MNDDEVKEFWNRTMRDHGGNLFVGGAVGPFALWCGFVLALERPDLLNGDAYNRIVKGYRPIELKFNVPEMPERK